MKKIYDISSPIFEGMPVYKNRPEKQPKIHTVTKGHVTESRLSLDVHSGSHIDAPLHMTNEGAKIESISIQDLVGQAKVFDLTNVNDSISKSDLEVLPIRANDFILFKTKNSFEEEFNYNFVYLNEEGARYLAEIGIRGVGIDSLGVERSQPNHPTHKCLFSNNVIIIEGLRLKDVQQGEYFMVAAPLKLIGTDAAPARVLLFD
ncbi:cyclase family protein [Peribacillus cavernae]|uniref:Kynurenine formamidase n=1 Tax=Peribacillus cavernae TaxID=1674310 RepID=A0A3S0W4N3_9BACI|nr:cyclase family protein [Peribacillus cavernae]MDQ0220719.1 arylformamidase [Peribacillus cavernae]RUQ32433.1 cyclase family protein [Peribacillus cavernae]